MNCGGVLNTTCNVRLRCWCVGSSVHLEHMHEVFPELVLDLLCYGPIEKGLDATHCGVEFYNLGIDGAALATAADSLAAIEQRVEQEQRLTWAQLLHFLDTDWAGADGKRARLMMQHSPRYGAGGRPRRLLGGAHHRDLYPPGAHPADRRFQIDARSLLLGKHARDG